MAVDSVYAMVCIDGVRYAMIAKLCLLQLDTWTKITHKPADNLMTSEIVIVCIVVRI